MIGIQEVVWALNHCSSAQSGRMSMIRGTASSQPVRYPGAFAKLEFSVKIFVLFMWLKVFEACTH